MSPDLQASMKQAPYEQLIWLAIRSEQLHRLRHRLATHLIVLQSLNRGMPLPVATCFEVAILSYYWGQAERLFTRQIVAPTPAQTQRAGELLAQIPRLFPNVPEIGAPSTADSVAAGERVAHTQGLSESPVVLGWFPPGAPGRS